MRKEGTLNGKNRWKKESTQGKKQSITNFSQEDMGV